MDPSPSLRTLTEGGMDPSAASAGTASSASDERINHEQMNKQFHRFNLIMNEIKKNMALLEEESRHSVVDSHPPSSTSSEGGIVGMSPLLQSSYFLFLELKSISRQLTNYAETTKTQMMNRKKRVDVINLQSESILYERAHFLKEIAIAQDFHSKLPQPELIPEKEYQQRHANTQSPSSPTPHQLWLSRLHDEHHQREELLSNQKSLESRNRLLVQANEEMRKRKKEFNEKMKSVYISLRESESYYFPSIESKEGQTTVPMDQ